jgi:hypothetical protein
VFPVNDQERRTFEQCDTRGHATTIVVVCSPDTTSAHNAQEYPCVHCRSCPCGRSSAHVFGCSAGKGPAPKPGQHHFSTLQDQCWEECERAGWDPKKRNSFGDETAHLHEEVSEAFRAYRKTHGFEITYDEDGKPQGVPIEHADVLIGLFYNAELNGYDLLEAVRIKHEYNLQRSYEAEGRRIHG